MERDTHGVFLESLKILIAPGLGIILANSVMTKSTASLLDAVKLFNQERNTKIYALVVEKFIR